jgi:hypothetical protein
MSEDWREREIETREAAQVHAGEIVPGSGSRGTPRRMAHMVSVRLDGELIRMLRTIAEQRGVTVSDLLREGAEQIVQKSYAAARPRVSYTISGVNQSIPTVADHQAYAAN